MVCYTDGVEDGYFKHYGWSFERFTDSWSISCATCQSFAATFGVLFPAATGIMEGANLSGDLKNPTYSIPVGTLAAIGTSIAFYLLLIISFAGSFNGCILREDTTIMQEAAWGGFETYLRLRLRWARCLEAVACCRPFPGTSCFRTLGGSNMAHPTETNRVRLC